MATEVRRYWLTASKGASTVREWFTVARDETTSKVFRDDLDAHAQANACFQIMWHTGPDEDEMTRHLFRYGTIILTDDDGTELARMDPK